ncbi:MAG: hypothetical protein ACPIOQ_40765, partial [Promethearchaeia archaeon]
HTTSTMPPPNSFRCAARCEQGFKYRVARVGSWYDQSAAQILKGGLDMECIDWGGNPRFSLQVCVCARDRKRKRERVRVCGRWSERDVPIAINIPIKCLARLYSCNKNGNHASQLAQSLAKSIRRSGPLDPRPTKLYPYQRCL